MNIEELKNYLKTCGLKAYVKNKKLLARVYAAYENDFKPVKTSEIEAALKTKYSKKLAIDDSYPIRLKHLMVGRMVFQSVLLDSGICRCLLFNLPQLGIKNLSACKNCKVCCQFKSGWLQSLLYYLT